MEERPWQRIFIRISFLPFCLKNSGEIKFGAYIASIISDVIDEIGEKNVVQVVIDNAANCRSAEQGESWSTNIQGSMHQVVTHIV